MEFRTSKTAIVFTCLLFLSALGGVIDVTVTTYEVNLVYYAMPAGERTWLLSYSNLKQVKQAAVKFGGLIKCPVLEHAAF